VVFRVVILCSPMNEPHSFTEVDWLHLHLNPEDGGGVTFQCSL
jgi:hypothetical protein